MRINKEACGGCNTAEAWKTLLEPLYPSMDSNWLDLTDCNLNDEQGIALFDYLYRRPIKFRVVDLSQNHLTDATAKKIAEVLVGMPSLCSMGWMGNMIKIMDNPISIVGLKACVEALKRAERQPDFIAFNWNDSITKDEWNEFTADYQKMQKEQDPIIRCFSWLYSFFGW